LLLTSFWVVLFLMLSGIGHAIEPGDPYATRRLYLKRQLWAHLLSWGELRLTPVATIVQLSMAIFKSHRSLFTERVQGLEVYYDGQRTFSSRNLSVSQSIAA
jgi:hypothetical protein